MNISIAVFDHAGSLPCYLAGCFTLPCSCANFLGELFEQTEAVG